MSFHEIRFPEAISRGSSGGPQRRTEIVTLASGYEERNANWADSRRKYNAGYGVKAADDLYKIVEFFEARHGRLNGFRWKDWSDFKSGPPQKPVAATDQSLGTGDGTTSDFQLVKSYNSGNQSYTRLVSKPVSGSIKLAVASVQLTEGVDFSVDDTTGLVTFTSPPGPGQTVTAGFEFDVPARFDTDFLEVNLSAFTAGQITNIPIVEIRL